MKERGKGIKERKEIIEMNFLEEEWSDVLIEL